MKKIMTVMLAVFMLMVSTCFAADVEGKVDWDGNIIQVTGVGSAPESVTRPDIRHQIARRTAMLDGYRNMLELVKGINIDSSTTVSTLSTPGTSMYSDTITSNINGVVRGARVISEKQNDDGSYSVTMAVKLFGAGSVAAAVVQPNQPTAFPEPTIVPAATPAKAVTDENLNMVTGVIVDARGLGLKRCMSPRIYDTTGRLVYGDKFVSYDFVVKYGMASYQPADKINSGLLTRAGEHPLMIKAVELKNFNSDIVVSVADADKMLQANKYGNFLINASMVFEYE
jgi:hypothetical protein